MKNTIVAVVLFILLSFLFSEKSLALIPIEMRNDIKLVATLVPTATPTPIVFKKIDPNIDIKIISTLTPTQAPVVVTKIVTPTTAEVSPTMAEDLNIEPSVVATKSEVKTEEKTENKVDLKTLFMGITVGLLVLIILIQLLPKKKVNQ